MTTPKLRVAVERAQGGAARLTAGCVALLEGRPDEVSDALLTAAGA